MQEIERKFLVKSEDFRTEARNKQHIIQGFLCTDPERTVRVRVAGENAYLTIKGISNASGMSRFEWEEQLSAEDGRNLLALCKRPLMEKIRYQVEVGNHIYEVDEFKGANLGLLLAEVELLREDEEVSMPHWIGEEVTGQKKYYNSQLSLKPFTRWKH